MTRLIQPENGKRLAEYLYDHQIHGLFPYLNRNCTDPAVEDKHLFAARRAGAGLPCAAILAFRYAYV